jgi:putative transposase
VEVRPRGGDSRERLRRELDEVLAGIGEHDDPVEAVALGARLILQHALEDEVTEFLGRKRYERAGGAASAVYRNGYEPRTVKTTSGAVEVERPRIRNAEQLGFESQVLGRGARTHALEALIILGFLRGLSVRDVEDLLEEALGEQVVGKSTVARICQDTRQRYRAWCARRLDGHDLVYCYLDAIYLKLRPRRPARRRRPGRLGPHAGRAESAARTATRQPRELRRLAGLRARSRRPRHARPGADHRRRRARDLESHA